MPDGTSKVVASPYHGFQWQEFACGWGSAVVNITVTYPIYKVIFRQMLHGVKTRHAVNQLVGEGVTFLYRGMLPPLAQKTISLSVMFGVYDATRKPLIEEYHMNPYYAKIIAGCVAGSVEAAIMPFERIQTLLADKRYHQHFQNTSQAFQYVWKNYGFLEFYRGLVPILIRNGPSNGLFFILREEANFRLPHRDGVSSSIQQFFTGALIGSFLSTLFYPCNVIKVQCQSGMGGPYINIVKVFQQVYNERNRKLVNFYKGCSINFSRAFISWGLINSSYEVFKNIIY